MLTQFNNKSNDLGRLNYEKQTIEIRAHSLLSHRQQYHSQIHISDNHRFWFTKTLTLEIH